MVENISDPPITTAREAMEFMSDKDLTFMATYYPMMFKAMCMMVTIENQLEIENKSEENERKETTTQKSQKEEKDKKENKNNNSAVKTSKENKNNNSALNNSKENKEKEKSRELEKSTNEIKKDRIESPKGNKENSNNNISKDVNATNENNKTEGGNLEANLEAEENIPLVQEDILDQTVILEEYETFPNQLKEFAKLYSRRAIQEMK